MRIALLFGSLNTGGAERQMIMLARALRDQGHEVLIYNSSLGQAKEKDIIDLGFNLRYFGHSGGTLNRLLWLKNDIKRLKVEIVISYHGYMSLYTGLLGKWLKIPSYGGVRSDFSRFLRLNGALKGKLLLSLVDWVIFNSEVSMKTAISQGAIRPERTIFIPNVIDFHQYHSNKKLEQHAHSMTLLFTGAIRSEKGIWDLLQSFYNLLYENQELGLKLRFAGTGDELELLKEQVDKLGLKEKVNILGDLSTMQVQNELGRADIFVFPSHSEGFPNSVLEAMSFGLPVISTAVGEVQRVIQSGENGILIPIGDIEKLQLAIKRLISSKQERTRMGENAAETVKEKFSYGYLAKNVNSILRLN